MKKICVIIAMIAFMSLSATTYAIDLPPTEYDLAFVYGNIYDDVEDPVVGADITVVCQSNSNSNTGTSIAEGYYFITLECPAGETVEVTATSGGSTGTSEGEIEYKFSTGMGDTRVDIGFVRVDVSIPEFPIAAIPAVLSMFSFGLIRRRLF